MRWELPASRIRDSPIVEIVRNTPFLRVSVVMIVLPATLLFAANLQADSSLALVTTADAPVKPRAESMRQAQAVEKHSAITTASGQEVTARQEVNEQISSGSEDTSASNSTWFSAEGLSNNSLELIRAIRNAPVHGLSPQRYALSALMQSIRQLQAAEPTLAIHHTMTQSSSNSAQQHQANHRQALSAQLDRAFLDLATHLGEGVVNGASVQRRMFHKTRPVDAEALLRNVRRGYNSVEQALASVTPDHAHYRRLSERLRNLLTERASGLVRTRILGQSQSYAPLNQQQSQALRTRLLDTGDLDPENHFGYGMDEPLIRALKTFQRRHGLSPNGRLDVPTRRVLDLSIEEEIQAISLNLERLRWMTRELGERYVWVNIPDFMAKVYHKDDKRLAMTAVVGKRLHATPTFSKPMSYLEFSPTWTVPSRITNEDLIPRERAQPGYLASRGFEALRYAGGELKAVPIDSVPATDFDLARFPYILRQRGGQNNALGRIKFMMPNRYAIYLHDTPKKQHFTHDVRAYSNGCIRLSDPEALARLLMQDDGYSEDTIDTMLQYSRSKGKSPRRVLLRTPVPTHLVYLTAWVDESGALQRRPDVYKQDASLLSALENTETLLSMLKADETARDPAT